VKVQQLSGRRAQGQYGASSVRAWLVLGQRAVRCAGGSFSRRPWGSIADVGWMDGGTVSATLGPMT
jgi:hypothetical protein